MRAQGTWPGPGLRLGSSAKERPIRLSCGRGRRGRRARAGTCLPQATCSAWPSSLPRITGGAPRPTGTGARGRAGRPPPARPRRQPWATAYTELQGLPRLRHLLLTWTGCGARSAWGWRCRPAWRRVPTSPGEGPV